MHIPSIMLSTYKDKKAFTLIELMVTVSIFMVITTVVLYQNSKFNSSILLTNSAYEVALTIRQAQVFGVASRKVTIGAFGTEGATVGGRTAYQIGYGVYFDKANSKSFTLFADVNSDSNYDASEIITTSTFVRDIRISDVCFSINGGAYQCNTVGTYDKATIIFRRPNPEPLVFKNTTNIAGISSIKIVLKADSSATESRCVIINSIGQTSVKSGANC